MFNYMYNTVAYIGGCFEYVWFLTIACIGTCMLERFCADSLGGKNPLFPFKASASSLEKKNQTLDIHVVLNVTEKVLT